MVVRMKSHGATSPALSYSAVQNSNFLTDGADGLDSPRTALNSVI